MEQSTSKRRKLKIKKKESRVTRKVGSDAKSSLTGPLDVLYASDLVKKGKRKN